MQSSLLPKLNTLKEFYKKHEKEAIEDYFTFLRFQSVSSEPQYKSHLEACAQWVVEYLKKNGLQN